MALYFKPTLFSIFPSAHLFSFYTLEESSIHSGREFVSYGNYSGVHLRSLVIWLLLTTAKYKVRVIQLALSDPLYLLSKLGMISPFVTLHWIQH